MANKFTNGILEEVRNSLKKKKEKEVVEKEVVADLLPAEPKFKKTSTNRDYWKERYGNTEIAGEDYFFGTNNIVSNNTEYIGLGYSGNIGYYGTDPKTGKNYSKEEYDQIMQKNKEEKEKIYISELKKAYVDTNNLAVMIHPKDQKAYALNYEGNVCIPLIELQYTLFNKFEEEGVVFEPQEEKNTLNSGNGWISKYLDSLKAREAIV